MKRRIYNNPEKLFSALTKRHAVKGDWLGRMAVKFEELGVAFPTTWSKEKRDDFIMTFLNTATVEDCGTKLSLMTAKEIGNDEALTILYDIIKAVSIT